MEPKGETTQVLQEGGAEVVQNVKLKDVETHVVIAGHVEMGGTYPIIAIRARKTSLSCYRGTDSSQKRK